MTDGCATLVVFLDAVPFALVEDLGDGWDVAPVVPGAGFSLNLFPTMFAGAPPDALGAFNNWTPREAPAATSSLGRGLRRVVDALTRRPQLLSRATHKAVRTALGGPNTANIPWQYLPYFRRSREPEDLDWIYGGDDWDVFGVGGTPSVALERDEAVFAEARAGLARGRSMFVKLISLDWVGHKAGPRSEAFRRRAEILVQRTRELVADFESVNQGRARSFLCSDHGMAEVDRTERVNLEGSFGPASPETYLYFLESTMVRVWSDDTARLTDIGGHLEAGLPGRVLSTEERAYFDLTNPDFGDLIFVLDTGAVFYPGWYGGLVPRGMHGYLSDDIDLHTAFAAARGAGGCGWASGLPNKSGEVYGFLTGAEAHG